MVHCAEDCYAREGVSPSTGHEHGTPALDTSPGHQSRAPASGTTAQDTSPDTSPGHQPQTPASGTTAQDTSPGHPPRRNVPLVNTCDGASPCRSGRVIQSLKATCRQTGGHGPRQGRATFWEACWLLRSRLPLCPEAVTAEPFPATWPSPVWALTLALFLSVPLGFGTGLHFWTRQGIHGPERPRVTQNTTGKSGMCDQMLAKI